MSIHGTLFLNFISSGIELFLELLILMIRVDESMNANTMHVRDINTQSIRQELRNTDFVSKNSLAKSTGLSVASCGKRHSGNASNW